MIGKHAPFVFKSQEDIGQWSRSSIIPNPWPHTSSLTFCCSHWTPAIQTQGFKCGQSQNLLTTQSQVLQLQGGIPQTLTLYTLSLRESRISWRLHKCHRFAKAALAFAIPDVICFPPPSPAVVLLFRYLKLITQNIIYGQTEENWACGSALTNFTGGCVSKAVHEP